MSTNPPLEIPAYGPVVYTYSIVKINDYYHIGFLEQNSSSRLVPLEFEHLLPITYKASALPTVKLWRFNDSV